MLVKRKIEITLTEEEKSLLAKTRRLLADICEEFSDCEEGCPMQEICQRFGNSPQCMREIIKVFEKNT